MAQKVASYYSSELNTEIRIDKVDIVFFDKVYLEGIYIEDQHQDTLLYANEISTNIGDWSISEKYFYLDNINLSDARVNLKTYKGDSTMNFQFLADYFASEDTTKSEFDFRIHEVNLSKVNFSLRNENDTAGGDAMNYSDLYLHNLGGKLSNFFMEDDQIFISIEGLNTIERSGFTLLDLTGDVQVSEKSIGISGLNIQTPGTHLKGHFAFKTQSYEDYGDFLNKVLFDVNLNTSIVEMKDVAFFVPMFKGYNEIVGIDTKVKGPINKMFIEGLDLKIKEQTHFHGDILLPNFSQIKSSDVLVNIDTLNTTMEEVSSIQIPPYSSGKTLALDQSLMTIGKVNMHGAVKGKMDDLEVDFDVHSDAGDVITKLNLYFDTLIDDYRYYGEVSTLDVELGKLASTDNLGRLTSYINLNGQSFDPEKMRIGFKGSKIQSLNAMNYEYHNIVLNKGVYENKKFDGKVAFKDRNMDFSFDGLINMQNKIPEFDLSLDVKKAKLSQLNLLDKDSSVNVVGKFNVNIVGVKPKDIFGNIQINNLRYTENDTLYDIGDVDVYRSKSKDTITLRSKLVDADVEGNIDFVDLGNSFVNLFKYAVPNLFEDTTTIATKREQFKFDIHLKDISMAIDYLNLPLEIAENSHVQGFYNDEKEIFSVTADADFLNYQTYQSEGFKFRMSEVNKNIVSTVKFDYLQINDSVKVSQPLFKGNVRNNLFEASIKWNENEFVKDGKIGVNGIVESPVSYEIYTHQSYFYLQNEKWEVSPDAAFLIDTSRIEVQNFSVHHFFKEISAHGVVSKKAHEKLHFGLNGIQLADFNGLLGGAYNLKGQLNAEGYVSDIYDKAKFQSEVNINGLNINEYEVGDIVMNQYYEPENKRILVVGDIKNKNTKTLGLKGSYDLAKNKNNLNLSVVFNNTDIAFVNAFVPDDQISNIRGILSGELDIKGEPTKPRLEGELDFMAGNVKVAMLNANFGFDGKVTVNQDYISMDYVPLYDENGNMGHLSATIFHENFKTYDFDALLDLQNDVDQFMVMNTFYEDGAMYYGSAYITGYVAVQGTQDLINIDADVEPKKGTVINLPLAGVQEFEENDFLTFINVDSSLIEVEDTSSFEGVVMNLNAHVTPDALFRLIYDESTGDVIQGRAEGDVSLKINQYGDLSMFGGVKLTEGNYQFTMTNLFTKKFEVVPGSDISWTGSPYDASIDIGAIYKLQAPLYDLMLGRLPEEDLKPYKRPEKVLCQIKLKETLGDPVTSFDFSVPSADETAQAVLQKTKSDEDEKNKQFFSLLLLNKFIASQGAGGSDAGVSAGATATADFVSNQLSSVLSQISEDYDVGVKYATDDFSSNNEFEVGLSTNLLNDRLRISGSFGVANSNDGEGSSSSNIIGDFAIDYNINEKGTFVLSVFNESNEFEVTDNISGHYTQGIGVSYREEFNSIEDFVFVQYILDIFRPEHKDKVPDKTIPLPDEGKEEEYIYNNFIKNR